MNPATNFLAFARAAWKHLKNGDVKWPMCVYISTVHWAFIVGVKTVANCRWQTLLLAFTLWLMG